MEMVSVDREKRQTGTRFFYRPAPCTSSQWRAPPKNMFQDGANRGCLDLFVLAAAAAPLRQIAISGVRATNVCATPAGTAHPVRPPAGGAARPQREVVVRTKHAHSPPALAEVDDRAALVAHVGAAGDGFASNVAGRPGMVVPGVDLHATDPGRDGPFGTNIEAGGLALGMAGRQSHGTAATTLVVEAIVPI